MKELNDLIDETNQRVLDYRSIQSLVSGDHFHEVYQSATKAERINVKLLIRWGDRKGVKHWVKTREMIPLEERGYIWLRTYASRLNIKYYGKLSKAQLISEIRKEEAK